MANPARLRDSTQIVLPPDTPDGLHHDLESEFSVTVTDEGPTARIIGSPLVIKDVSRYLARHGVALPRARAGMRTATTPARIDNP